MVGSYTFWTKHLHGVVWAQKFIDLFFRCWKISQEIFFMFQGFGLLVQVFYGKHIDPDIEFWHHCCSLLGFAGQWTVILGCHMILLAVDLCFYESFNIILPGGVPVGVLMLRPTSYRPLRLWMYQVGTIVFILIFAFGDLILSRLC